MPTRRPADLRAWHAVTAYLAAALAGTWPLTLGLGRDVAWDLGDSILNMWILGWDCEQLRHILTGDLSRIASFFDANIFYPAPLSLAFSEHLVPQALQILPIYLVSGNLILCYNLLFLSTIVLSGLGMFLLVRELTGNPIAAFTAGLLFAFAPYRIGQSTHLQVLSAQWMPFVCYGLARYFRSGGSARGSDGGEYVGRVPRSGHGHIRERTRRHILPLAGATLALVVQGLSCGYYLLFFTPFAIAFALWEIGRLRVWRDARMWGQLAGAGVCAGAMIMPFVLPYAAIHAGFASRSLSEISRFSADVYAYATASPEQRLWGGLLQAMPKPEGRLFPGLVPVLLAVLGLLAAGPLRGTRPTYVGRVPRRGWTFVAPWTRRARWLAWLLGALAIGHGIAAILTLVLRRISLDTGLFVLRIGNINQLLLRALIAVALLLVVSPAARARMGVFMRDRGYFVIGLAAAVWLSLGPMPQSLGRPIELAAPYRLLVEYVPGYDGLRVPARFAMIAAFMLAALAGFGADLLTRTRARRWTLVIFGAIFWLEATPAPFVVNGMSPLRDYNPPDARLYRAARAPAVYREMARQAADSVVLELPLGQPDYDLRAMYYSTVHWRPLVNGYSGFIPPHYGRLITAFSEIPRHRELSLQVLRASGATHVILHESAYHNQEGVQTAAILQQAGAVELWRDGSDVLLAVRRP